MSDLNIIVDHRLSVEEIKKRIDGLISEEKKEHSHAIKELNVDWNGNEGNIKGNVNGRTVTGTITVTEESMVLKGDIPLLSIGFESKIESEIRERLMKITYDKI